MCRPASMPIPLPFALLGQPGDRTAFREICWKKVHSACKWPLLKICWKKVHSACKWPLLSPQESRGLEARREAMPHSPGSFTRVAAGVVYGQPWEGLDSRRGEEEGSRWAEAGWKAALLAPACVTGATATVREWRRQKMLTVSCTSLRSSLSLDRERKDTNPEPCCSKDAKTTGHGRARL